MILVVMKTLNILMYKKEYDKYKSGNRDKLCLLSSLLFTKDNNEKNRDY